MSRALIRPLVLIAKAIWFLAVLALVFGQL